MTGRRALLAGVAALVAQGAAAQTMMMKMAPRPMVPDGALQVYAAMTLRPALDAVLAAWHATGAGMAVGIYGPTPVLVKQLADGAPADLLLTADADWMDDAVRRGVVQAASRADLLRNTLVLAVESGAPSLAAVGPGFPIEQALAGGRLAMCDPEHDPAGRYAKQALTSLGLWPQVAARIAIAESSPAAVVLLQRGEVKLAACFATDIHGVPGVTTAGVFPDASHAPIVTPGALAMHAQPGAAALLDYLKGPAAAGMFAEYGYRAA